MLITTMNDVPGHEITDVYGEVFGLTVRSRNAFSQLGAGLKSMLGGELKGMTKALADSRLEVTQRMVDEAEAKGANAIVAMRFSGPRSARTAPRSGSTGSELVQRRVVQRDAVAPERVAGCK